MIAKMFLAIVLFVLALAGIDSLTAAIEPIEEPISTRVKSISVGAVVQHIQSLSDLSTGSSWVQTVVTSEQNNKIFGVEVGHAELLYVAYGRVVAGVDLSELDASRISVKKYTIHVLLPRAVVLDAKIDVDQSFVYDLRTSMFFPPETMFLQSDAEQEALAQVIETALESNLLEVATENAAEIVKELLEGFVDAEVVIEIE
jgi:hypothetical protein